MYKLWECAHEIVVATSKYVNKMMTLREKMGNDETRKTQLKTKEDLPIELQDRATKFENKTRTMIAEYFRMFTAYQGSKKDVTKQQLVIRQHIGPILEICNKGKNGA